MKTTTRLGVAVTAIVVFGGLAFIFGERSFVWALWFMVAVLFLLFAWFVSTVAARPVDALSEPPSEGALDDGNVTADRRDRKELP